MALSTSEGGGRLKLQVVWDLIRESVEQEKEEEREETIRSVLPKLMHELPFLLPNEHREAQMVMNMVLDLSISQPTLFSSLEIGSLFLQLLRYCASTSPQCPTPLPTPQTSSSSQKSVPETSNLLYRHTVIRLVRSMWSLLATHDPLLYLELCHGCTFLLSEVTKSLGGNGLCGEPETRENLSIPLDDFFHSFPSNQDKPSFALPNLSDEEDTRLDQKRKRNVDYGPHKRMRREKEHPPFQIWSSAGVLRFHWLLMYLMREQIEKHKDLLWHWRGSGSPLWGIISLSLNHCPFSHIYSTTLLLKSLLEGMRGQGQHQVPVNHWVDKVGSLLLTFICSINDWSSLCFLAPPILTQFENNPSGEEGRDYKEIQLREERVVVTLSSCLEAWIFYAPGNRIILQTHWDQWANVLQKKIHEVPAPIQVAFVKVSCAFANEIPFLESLICSLVPLLSEIKLQPWIGYLCGVMTDFDPKGMENTLEEDELCLENVLISSGEALALFRQEESVNGTGERTVRAKWINILGILRCLAQIGFNSPRVEAFCDNLCRKIDQNAEKSFYLLDLWLMCLILILSTKESPGNLLKSALQAAASICLAISETGTTQAQALIKMYQFLSVLPLYSMDSLLSKAQAVDILLAGLTHSNEEVVDSAIESIAIFTWNLSVAPASRAFQLDTTEESIILNTDADMTGEGSDIIIVDEDEDDLNVTCLSQSRKIALKEESRPDGKKRDFSFSLSSFSKFLDHILRLSSRTKSQRILLQIVRCIGLVLCCYDFCLIKRGENGSLSGSALSPTLFFESSRHSHNPQSRRRSLGDLVDNGFELWYDFNPQNMGCPLCCRSDPRSDLWERDHQSGGSTSETQFAELGSFLMIIRESPSPIRLVFFRSSFGKIVDHLPLSELRIHSNQIVDNFLDLALPQTTTREALVPLIRKFVSPCFSDHLIKVLKRALSDASLNRNTLLTVLSALGELGRLTTDKDIILIVILVFLAHLGRSRGQIKAHCLRQFRSICEIHSGSGSSGADSQKKLPTTELTRQLFDRFSRLLFPTLMRDWEPPHEHSSSHTIPPPIIAASELLGGTPVEFVKRALPDTLPVMILEERSASLTEIAAFLKIDVKDMLRNHLSEILSTILINSESATTTAALSTLTGFLKASLTTTFTSVRTSLVMHLLEHLGTKQTESDRTQCLRALNLVATLTESSEGSDPDSSSSQRKKNKGKKSSRNLEEEEESSDGSPSFLHSSKLLPDEEFCVTLSKWLIWILDHILLSGRMDDSSKKLAHLKGLRILFEMLGARVSALRPKVMTTLRLAMEEPELREEACLTWSIFVKNLEPDHLGPILSLLIVDLLPHLQLQSVISIFEYIFVEKEKELRRYYSSIPFIPTSRDLEKFRTAWARGRILVPSSSASSSSSFPFSFKCPEGDDDWHVELKQLKDYLETCDSEGVRLLVVERIRELCRDQIWPDDEDHGDLCRELIRALIKGLQRASQLKNRMPFLECLGELGPRDVSLARSSSSKSSLDDVGEDVSEKLIVPILKMQIQFVRSAPNTAASNAAGIAIQELLRLCAGAQHKKKQGIAQSDIRDEVWENFDEDERTLLLPFLTSKYKNKAALGPASTGCLFPRAKNFGQWIGDWAYLLSTQLPPQHRKMFAPCQSTFGFDSRLAMFLLPHLLLRVILRGKEEDRKAIFTELDAVLSSGVSDSSQLNDQFLQKKELQQLGIQALFQIVDTLFKWCRDQEIEANRKLFYEQQLKEMASKKRRLPREEFRYHSNWKIVLDLLQQLQLSKMAEAAQKSGAHSRAILYFEQYLRQKKPAPVTPLHGSHLSPEDVATLETIIQGSEDELDLLFGLQRKSGSGPSDESGDGRNADRWLDHHAECELLIQRGQGRPQHHINRLRYLSWSGHLDSVLSLVRSALPALSSRAQLNTPPRGTSLSSLCDSLFEEKEHWRAEDEVVVLQLGIQAALMLGQWSRLSEFVDASDGLALGSFYPHVGSALLKLRIGNRAEVESSLEKARETLAGPMAAVSLESYQHSYLYLLRLSALYEVGSVAQLLDLLGDCKGSSGKAQVTFAEEIGRLSEVWEHRLREVPSLYQTGVELLGIRIGTLSALQCTLDSKRQGVSHFASHYRKVHLDNASLVIKEMIKRCWLRIGHMARLQGLYSSSSHALETAFLLRSEEEGYADQPPVDCDLKILFERMKLTWKTEKQHHQVKDQLNALLMATKKSAKSSSQEKTQQSQAKALLLLGRYMEEAAQAPVKDVIKAYQKAIDECPDWEKGYFFLGQYTDKIVQTFNARTNVESSPYLENKKRLRDFYRSSKETRPVHYLSFAIKNYGLSLQFGHKYLFQSLPRLLTLWFGDEITLRGKETDELSNVAKVMEELFKELHAHIWLMCLPQLVSRVCHSDSRVFELLKNILRKVLDQFPYQAFWSFIGTLQSTSEERKKKANLIMRKLDSSKFEDSLVLSDLLEKLVMLELGKHQSKSLTLSKSFSELYRWRGKALMPIQSQLTPHLPRGGAPGGFSPFSEKPVMLVSFKDHIAVLPSLQKPLRVAVAGSDGVSYPLLVKKDALRKDARIMELSLIMNRLLQRDPDSMKRGLRIKTYAVVALNEDCGVVEWVQNMSCFRIVLQEQYVRQYGPSKFKSDNALAHRFAKESNTNSRAKSKFEKSCKQFCRVFYNWFLYAFPNPQTWFFSRNLYSRSLAVMSMVGSVLGLGDRHAENILIDTSSGEIMHVDFNCLFWRGLEFSIPERVPFRLTPNLLDGMGCTGSEGVFKKACVITLRILRENRGALLSVLETLVHDPLAEWTSKDSTKRSSRLSKAEKDSGGITLSQKTREGGALHARAIIHKVTDFLEGQHDTVLPLSVEGHVQSLIGQATDPENLGKMFAGWACYM